jgi:hypothetical protein
VADDNDVKMSRLGRLLYHIAYRGVNVHTPRACQAKQPFDRDSGAIPGEGLETVRGQY